MRVSLQQAAAALRQKARAIEQRAREAERASGRDALNAARAYSSGPLRQTQIAVMGHPYARRWPRPPFSAAIINVQTGRFRAAWRLRGPEAGGTGIRTVITNTAPEARFLTERGTKLMIGRPIVRAIAQTLRRVRERRLAAATRAGLKA